MLVYSSAAMKIRTNPSTLQPIALQQTAKLFRAFGEEYHEKKLEEAYIFPAVNKVQPHKVKLDLRESGLISSGGAADGAALYPLIYHW